MVDVNPYRPAVCIEQSAPLITPRALRLMVLLLLLTELLLQMWK